MSRDVHRPLILAAAAAAAFGQLKAKFRNRGFPSAATPHPPGPGRAGPLLRILLLQSAALS